MAISGGLLLLLLQQRHELLLAAANHGHKTNAIALCNGAGPAFQLHETPVREIDDFSILVALGWKEKKLHPFFLNPDLGDSPDLVIIKHSRAEGLESRELCGDIVMLEPVL